MWIHGGYTQSSKCSNTQTSQVQQSSAGSSRQTTIRGAYGCTRYYDTAVRGTDNVDLSARGQVFVLAAILTRAPAVTAGHNGTTLHSTTPAASSYRRTRPGMIQGTLVPYEMVQSMLA